MNENRICDYFVICGVPEENDCHHESVNHPAFDPITDITVINRSYHEPVPQGYECIEKTPNNHEANLNHGTIQGSKFFLCIKRGRDKPPLLDIGVLHSKYETMSPECKMIKKTPSGFSANLNTTGTTEIYLTYRRSTKPTHYNQLVVSDICVILTSKNESPPHAFCKIDKNLNKGYLAFRSDAFLCYKKSMDRPPHFLYNPILIDRYPIEDNPQYPLPQNLPLFCLPMGATIECWPKNDSINVSLSTFILTTNVGTKIYGTLLNYYEKIDPNLLSDNELVLLKFVSDSKDENRIENALKEKSLQRIKSMCILSQWPFFNQFKNFLIFIYRNFVCKPSTVPLEFYVYHFMKNIPFPTPDRPNIMVNLGESTMDNLFFSHNFDDCPIPSNGASFKKLLQNLGPDNCIYLLLFVLTEQKILIHSLRLNILTEIAETLVSMIFPFNWNCPYIPLCPLNLSGVLNAPLPFIVGIYSQYFDYFEPPSDVISISLDTQAIHIADTKRSLNLDLLPKKNLKFLKERLEEIHKKINYTIKHNKEYDSSMRKKIDKQIDIEIQEAFLYFMVSIMKDFQYYLKPITAAPKVGATDPTTLFDFEGFLEAHKSNIDFYCQITKTQMFTKFIEERSLVSDKNISLAFFDDCIEKVEKYEYINNQKRNSKLNLIHFEDREKSSKTVFISLPFLINESDNQESKLFDGRLKKDLFEKFEAKYNSNNKNVVEIVDCTDSCSNTMTKFDSELQCYVFARRAKYEIVKAQRIAQQSSKSDAEWAKCLLSNAYSLWFLHFPAFSFALLNEKKSYDDPITSIKPLSLAYEVLRRMQTMNFSVPDESCYRILMILCCIHNRPALAVKIFLDMKKYNVKLNAITYGYYNKAVLDGNWSTDYGIKSRWNKISNVLRVAMYFKIKFINLTTTAKSISSLNENYIVKKNAKSLFATKINEENFVSVDYCTSAGILSISNRNDVTSTLFKSDLNLLPKNKSKSCTDINNIEKDWNDILDYFKTIKTDNDNQKNQSFINKQKESNSNIMTNDDAIDDDNSEMNIFSNSFVAPLKYSLVNMDFSKSPVADKLRTSFRIAKNFTKSRYSSARSTFSDSEKNLNKIGSLFSPKSETKSNNIMRTPPSRLPRSSTLPQTFQTSAAQINEIGMSSPSEYFYSTVKSIGGRINEFKLSLGNSGINSPVDMMNAVTSRWSSKNEDENINLSIDNIFDRFDENSFDYNQYKNILNEYYTKALIPFISDNQIIWKVEMLSCTICRSCQSIIYDEEIMYKWLPDDSNLNTCCIYCKAKFVPSLTVYIKDYRCMNDGQRQIPNDGRLLDPISVPYLSPLVLRKELENILNGESYSSLIQPKFVDDHSIVYWNLVWYFTRLNLSSHIFELALFATSLNSSEIIEFTKKSGYNFKNVCVTCLWDNEKFYQNLPIHQQWLKIQNYQSENLNRELLDLKNVCQQLIESMKEHELFKPLQFLISERNKLKKLSEFDAKQLNSLYRELLFLNLIHDPPALDVDLFDDEYRSAFESLTNKDKESLIPIDNPLQNGAIYCRSLFKSLKLIN